MIDKNLNKPFSLFFNDEILAKIYFHFTKNTAIFLFVLLTIESRTYHMNLLPEEIFGFDYLHNQ
jgi:hypothetical protein